MNTPRPTEDYSASAFKKDVIMKFGEWLERANERRGLCEDGQEIQSVEGLPLKYQPDYKPSVEFENVIVDTSGQPLRTTPRPHAVG